MTNPLWHPCSQMKEYEVNALLEISGANGCYLSLKDGRKLFDAISSWWCKSLGHAHPRLKNALLEQLNQFEHVILAGTTNDTIVALSEKLAQLVPGLNKVFYASDGSSAIEIAMKMSRHVRMFTGDHQRTQFLALKNGYHGETLGALSASDVGLYRKPYESMLMPIQFIQSIPYANHPFGQCNNWEDVQHELEPYKNTATAILFEPIVQGAGGMKIYSADFLRRLSQWAHAHNIHVIADEIMTGFGRTGKMFAIEHANITPDFVCLSKGLTGGMLPMSAVLTSQAIYDYFYRDHYADGFLHSHTQSGNALSASVALEVLRIIEDDNIIARANHIGDQMLREMQAIAEETGLLSNVRGVGAVVAADMIPHPFDRNTHHALINQAVNEGIMLRPLGKTLYWMPPLVANENDLSFLADATKNSLHAIFKIN